MPRLPPLPTSGGGGGVDTNGLIYVGRFTGPGTANWDLLTGISTDLNNYFGSGIIVPSANPSIFLRMNGADASFTYLRQQFQEAGAPGVADAGNGIGATAGGAWLVINKLEILSAGSAGPGRRIFGTADCVHDNGSTKTRSVTSWTWEGAANGTSFGMRSGTGNIGATSYMDIWRQPRS